jgi:hypothetical protein
MKQLVYQSSIHRHDREIQTLSLFLTFSSNSRRSPSVIKATTVCDVYPFKFCLYFFVLQEIYTCWVSNRNLHKRIYWHWSMIRIFAKKKKTQMCTLNPPLSFFLFLCPSAWNNSAPNGWNAMEFPHFYSTLSRKFKFELCSDVSFNYYDQVNVNGESFVCHDGMWTCQVRP